MQLLQSLALAGFAVLAFAQDANSLSAALDLTLANFDEVTSVGKPVFAEFYSPLCDHCQTFAPVWEQLALDLASYPENITIAKSNIDADRTLGTKLGLTKVPTLIWFDGKGGQGEYNGGRGIGSLEAFVKKKTGVKPYPPSLTPLPVSTSGSSSSSPSAAAAQPASTAPQSFLKRKPDSKAKAKSQISKITCVWS